MRMKVKMIMMMDSASNYSLKSAWEGVGVSEKHLGEIELREETVGIRILARRRVEDLGPEITGLQPKELR